MALSLNPEMAAELVEAVHVNSVPATSEVSVMFVEVLLQMLLLRGLLERSGVG